MENDRLSSAQWFEQANDSLYGLAASEWSDNLNRAHRVARALNVGTVSVNTVDALICKYTQLKTTWFALR